MTQHPEHSDVDPVLAAPWAHPGPEVAGVLEVEPARGLDDREAAARLARHGPNQLTQAARRSVLAIFIAQFRSLIIALLGAAVVAALVFGEYVEAGAIGAALLINAVVGFVTELSAFRSVEALRQLASVKAAVRRGGRVVSVPAVELVPGDILVFEGGDVVTADVRVTAASKLQANESALTGESMPVGKRATAIAPDAMLAERDNMLFKGTSVTRGSGEGVVVATGMDSELGQISRLVQEAHEEVTPLERRLERLGQALVWATLLIGVGVAGAGIAAGKDTLLVIETAIALAVAAVPEGLPIIATIALARGMHRMARHRALVNKLSAVETLGATSVICTDKTGTLTENRMTVTQVTAGGAVIALGDEPVPEAALAVLRIGVLCNNADLSGVGDPLEVALLEAGRAHGLARDALVAAAPEVREVAFDPDVAMMATVHEVAGGFEYAVKGAPEAVLGRAGAELDTDGERPLDEAGRARWLQENERMAAEGLRVLAVARKQAPDPQAPPYADLCILGLVGLHDPPRREVAEAIAGCHRAGIRVVMVTGDQPVTARNVAMAVGITDRADATVVVGSELRPPEAMDEAERRRVLSADLFARVNPKQKLDLIALHQGAGNIVAMTGDGVNDAPALKKADIGVAMGQRGTAVARQAAHMILEDDSFSTIVYAVEQGRIIFDNIRAFVVYLLSCNISEILVIALATVAGAPLPLLPLQILYLNLVTDVFPALALGVGEGDASIMDRRPRPASEPVMASRHWRAVIGYGALITVAVLGAFAAALEWLALPVEQSVAVSFSTLALAQLWHVLDLRGPDTRLLCNEIVRNRYIWGAVILCVALVVAALYLPPLARILGLVDPGAQGWALIVGFSLLPVTVGQLWIGLRR